MQENKENIDLLIRSLLENAEEAVPPHIWDAVSSGVRPKPARPFFIWKRAAAVVAVAAALALGVFFGLRSYPFGEDISIDETLALNADDINTQREDIFQETNEEPLADEAFKGAKKLLADAGPALKSRPEPMLPNDLLDGDALAEKEAPVYAEETFSEPVEEVASEEVPEETLKSQEAVSAKDLSSLEAEKKDGYEEDPFAKMAWEDSREEKSSGIAFSVGGDIQNNGNARSSSGISMKHIKGRDIPTETNVEQVSKESAYSVPISVGLGVRFPVYRRLSIGTGINYSMMERTFTGVYTEFQNGVNTLTVNSDIRNTLHYVGVPLNLYYNVLGNKGLNLYVFAGGTVEKAVVNRYRIFVNSGDKFHSAPVKGVQLSAAAGFGVEFRLAKHLGLYVDPSLRYYFDSGQPVSIRTQQPLMMSFEIGFRATL